LKKNRIKEASGARVTLFEHLKKPEIGLKDVLEWGQFDGTLSYEETRYIESETKYEGYIRKQEREIAKAGRTDSMRIPEDMDFRGVSGLTREAVEKLVKMRPSTLGQARKIPGMTPAAVQNLGLHLEIQRKKGAVAASVSRETEPGSE
jgi:tRNA uridine 5-carboxymethylaminomethyl modification enzyme